MTEPTTYPDPENFRQVGPDYGPERVLIETLLDFHRGTLLWKVAGLSPEQLTTRAGGASQLTLLGIVRHLAKVERFWWRIVATQTADGKLYADVPDADFNGGDAATAEADIATLRAEIEAARAAVAEMSLDLEFPSNEEGPMSLRWVYLHMIQEYARHNGHVDILRENIDGLVGE